MDFLLSLDQQILHLINSTLSHPWLDAFFPAITDLHKNLWFQILIPATLLFFCLRLYGKRGLVIFAGLVVALGLGDFVSGQYFKKSVQRSRPFEAQELQVTQRSPAHGWSFPSNHALNMTTSAIYLSAFFPGAAPMLAACATLVIYSRIYNGVHYPSDVMAGALIGLLFGLLFRNLVRRFLGKRFS